MEAKTKTIERSSCTEGDHGVGGRADRAAPQRINHLTEHLQTTKRITVRAADLLMMVGSAGRLLEYLAKPRP